jgi:hypothetical protein
MPYVDIAAIYVDFDTGDHQGSVSSCPEISSKRTWIAAINFKRTHGIYRVFSVARECPLKR